MVGDRYRRELKWTCLNDPDLHLSFCSSDCKLQVHTFHAVTSHDRSTALNCAGSYVVRLCCHCKQLLFATFGPRALIYRYISTRPVIQIQGLGPPVLSPELAACNSSYVRRSCSCCTTIGHKICDVKQQLPSRGRGQTHNVL